MRTVTIHRCPSCDSIINKTDQLVADLKKAPDLEVNVVDGDKGEFSVEVDGRRLNENELESGLVDRIRGPETVRA